MIAVIGGTGRLGRLVSARLVEAGEHVRVVARSATSTAVPGMEFVAADLRDPSTLAPALNGVDTVVAAAHGMSPGAGSRRPRSTATATSPSSRHRGRVEPLSSSSPSSTRRRTTRWSSTG